MRVRISLFFTGKWTDGNKTRQRRQGSTTVLELEMEQQIKKMRKILASPPVFFEYVSEKIIAHGGDFCPSDFSLHIVRGATSMAYAHKDRRHVSLIPGNTQTEWRQRNDKDID